MVTNIVFKCTMYSYESERSEDLCCQDVFMFNVIEVYLLHSDPGEDLTGTRQGITLGLVSCADAMSRVEKEQSVECLGDGRSNGKVAVSRGAAPSRMLKQECMEPRESGDEVMRQCKTVRNMSFVSLNTTKIVRLDTN